MAILTILGAMAAHCFARYRFPGNRLLYFLIFSAIIFPSQVTIISLFQVLVNYGLFNTRTSLTLVYVSIQLPLTMYILESFFAQIPQELYEAAKIDGCSDYNIFYLLAADAADWRSGHRHDHHPELHQPLE